VRIEARERGVDAAQEGLGHGERQRGVAARAKQRDASAEHLDRARVLPHDCPVVTGAPWWPAL
jgi:hypothetical protein